MREQKRRLASPRLGAQSCGGACSPVGGRRSSEVRRHGVCAKSSKAAWVAAGRGISTHGGSAPRRRGQPRGATSNGSKTTEFPSIGGRRKIEAGVV
jgi:hypothetical protein